MRTAAVAVLAFLMLLPALPAQAQVGYHAGVAMDLWDRDAGYEEAYFLGGLSWTPGGWEYRASAAVLVRQSDSSLGRLFHPGNSQDIMGYCNNRWSTWISDYNFTLALAHRLQVESSAAAVRDPEPRRALLLWGGVHDGHVALEPASAGGVRLSAASATAAALGEAIDVGPDAFQDAHRGGDEAG